MKGRVGGSGQVRVGEGEAHYKKREEKGEDKGEDKRWEKQEKGNKREELR